MQARNVPAIDAGYWLAILAASMCGANSGDALARILHLGHVNGLLPLAIVFLLIVFAERWSGLATVAWYWLAIIVLRTGATNLADLATHDLKLGYQLVEAALAVLLVVFVAADRAPVAAASAVGSTARAVPSTTALYWCAMLTAGTLGTALGDDVADNTGLGTGLGSLVLLGVFAVALVVTYGVGRGGVMWKAGYWLAIVAARTAGTTMGDFLASRRGAGLGLPLSLLCTTALLAAIVVATSRPPAAASGSASS